MVVFGAPLLYSTLVYHPFSSPKIVALAVAAALTVVAVSTLPGSGVRLPPIAPLLGIALALALAGISYAMSPLPGVSLWGRPNQEVGFLVMMYTLLMYLLGMLLTEPLDSAFDPVQATVWAALPVLFLTGWALAGLPLSDNLTSAASGRPGATFGNPVHLAAYLAATAVVTAGLALHTERLRPRLLFSIVGAVCVAGVLLAASRAALLGLLAGVAVLAVAGGRRLPRRWLTGGGIVIVLGLLGAAALNPGESIMHKLSSITDPTFYGARWHAWGMAVTAFADRPLFGAGPANFERIFYGALTPQLQHDYFAFERFSDAHNWVLELGSTYGIPFLVVFGWLVLRPVRRFHSLPPSRRVVYAGAVSLMVSYLFNPLALSTLPLLALYAGLAGGLPRAIAKKGPLTRRRRWRALVIGTGVLVAAALLVPGLYFARADFELRQGSRLDDFDRMKAAADGLRPGLPSFYYPPGRKLSYEADRNPTPEMVRALDEFYAIPQELDPQEPDTELQWAVGLLGLKEYDQAIAHLDRALEISPQAPHTLSLMAVVYIERGEPERAIPILVELQRDYPDEQGVQDLLDEAEAAESR